MPDEPIIRRTEDCPIEKWETGQGEIVRWWTLISGDRTPSEGLTVGLAEISVGAVVPQQGHSHEENEVYFILEGQGTLHGPSEKTRVAKGEAIYIPGGTEHHITNTGNETLRLLYIFDTDAFSDVEYNKKSPDQE